MAVGWAAPGTDPAAADLGLDWVAQEDQAAAGLAVVVEQVEVAVPEAAEAVAPACGILGFPVAAEVALGQARVGPVEEVDPEAVAGVWAVLEGAAEAELAEDLVPVVAVLEMVEVPELAVEQDRVVESAGVAEQDPVEVAGQGQVAVWARAQVEVAEQDPVVLGPEAPRELHRENG